MKKVDGVDDETRTGYKRSDFGKLERGKFFREVAKGEPVKVCVAIYEEAIVCQLEEEGVLSPPGERPPDVVPLAELPGGLARFLESRR